MRYDMAHELDRFFGEDFEVEYIFFEGKEAVLVNGELIVCIDGRVFRKTKKYGFIEVNGRKKSTGYTSTYFKGKEISTHRLVAWFFVPNMKAKPEINHRDGNKLNNSAMNLEWCNRSENMKHAYRMGLHPRTGRRARGATA